MRRPGKRPAWLLLGLATLLSGCSSQDADQLARVSHKVAAKLDDLTGNAKGKLAGGLETFVASWDEATLDSRVATRLRWDKQLDGAEIQVFANGGVVELKGTVANLDQRRRAMDLALSTKGVEQVVDGLVTPETSP